MMCDEKIRCMDCMSFSSCPSNTRVFMNYCGSMPRSLKDYIYRARIDCRVRRRMLKCLGNGVPAAMQGVHNAVILPADIKMYEALHQV